MHLSKLPYFGVVVCHFCSNKIANDENKSNFQRFRMYRNSSPNF